MMLSWPSAAPRELGIAIFGGAAALPALLVPLLLGLDPQEASTSVAAPAAAATTHDLRLCMYPTLPCPYLSVSTRSAAGSTAAAAGMRETCSRRQARRTRWPGVRGPSLGSAPAFGSSATIRTPASVSTWNRVSGPA